MPETITTYILLCGSAILAGAINSIAGGGTLLTFPALFHALNGNGVLANGTSTIALVPGSIAGAWGYRQELVDKRTVIVRLLVPSLIGGAVGALLVTRFPQEVFNALVPWLILSASLLFLLQKPLQNYVRARRQEAMPGKNAALIVIGVQFLIALYGGYFGAGIGILMLSSLAFMMVDDIHHINGVKTVLSSAINAVAVVVFIAEGQVNWNYAGAMAVAAIIGGYFGARMARRLPAIYVRAIVIFIGFTLSAYYFWQQFR